MMLVIWKVAVLTAIGIFGLSGNVMVLVTLLKNPRVMGESQRFILNQAVIDALAALLLFASDINICAMGIVIPYQDNWVYDLLCKTWSTGGFLWGFMTASSYGLVFLTLDRFLKIRHPFWCRKYYTSSVVKVFLVLPWIIGPAFQIGMQVNMSEVISGECVMKMVFGTWGKITTLMICAVEFYIPILAIAILYGAILARLRHRDDTMIKCIEEKPTASTSQQEVDSGLDVDSTAISVAISTTNITADSIESPIAVLPPVQEKAKVPPAKRGIATPMAKKTQQAERKVTITVAVICGGFFLCYIMSQGMFLLEIAGLIQINFAVFDVAQILGFANCAINPVIYVLLHDKLRKTFLDTLSCKK